MTIEDQLTRIAEASERTNELLEQMLTGKPPEQFRSEQVSGSEEPPTPADEKPKKTKVKTKVKAKVKKDVSTMSMEEATTIVQKFLDEGLETDDLATLLEAYAVEKVSDLGEKDLTPFVEELKDIFDKYEEAE